MGLKRLVARRILLSVPTAIGVITIIFVALLPINPMMRVAFFVRSPRDLIPSNLDRLIHRYGLDRPLLLQWVDWLKKVATLDFGVSLPGGQPAMELVFSSLPVTFELIVYSAPLIIGFGLWLGTKAGLHHNRPVDHIVRVAGTLGTTLPVFLVAGLVVAITIAQTGFIPAGRLSYGLNHDFNVKVENGTFAVYTGMISIDALLNGEVEIFLDALAHLVLPVMVLVFTQGVALIRLTRSGVIEESGKQYFLSARAKGLSRKDAVYKHARKNAAISVLTVSGVLIGNMLTSLVIVERVFYIHGFGSLAVSAAQNLNMTVVFACATFVALLFVLINLVVDILYGIIDPRIKLG
jgi:peptide/nickel transport system permease protein